MSLTEEQVKALPPTAFVERHVPLPDNNTTRCAECGDALPRLGSRYVSAVPHVFICPSCYARHPEAPAAEAKDVYPKFALWAPMMIVYRESAPGVWERWDGQDPRPWTANTCDLENTHWQRCSEREAREHAARHNKNWPESWGEPASEPGDDGWQYGTDTFDGEAFRWHAKAEGYEYCNGGGETWHGAEDRPDWRGRCERGDDGCRTCTKAEARKNLESHGGTWPAEPLEVVEELPEPEPDGEFPSDSGCTDCTQRAGWMCGYSDARINDPAASCSHPSPAKPEPEQPQPVGYACKECGRMWTHDECEAIGEAGDDASTCECGGEMLAGPLPGPWQDTHEWLGERRLCKQGDWVVSSLRRAWQADFNSKSTIYHILRPKQAQPEAKEWPAEGKWLVKDEHITFHFRGPLGKEAKAYNNTGDCVGYEYQDTCDDRLSRGWRIIAYADLPWVQAKEPGEQCKGCVRLATFLQRASCRHGEADGLQPSIANPTNDCEHYRGMAKPDFTPVIGVVADVNETPYATADFTPKQTQAPGLWKGLVGFWSARTGWITPRKEVPMETRKRSLPVRMLIGSGKAIGAWSLKTLATMGLGLYLYHHWGACWAFVNDPGAVLLPAWDATAAFLGAKLPYAAAFGGIGAVAYLMGRIRSKA